MFSLGTLWLIDIESEESKALYEQSIKTYLRGHVNLIPVYNFHMCMFTEFVFDNRRISVVIYLAFRMFYCCNLNSRNLLLVIKCTG